MANQVDQRFVLFKNDKYIKAKKADGSQISLFKVNASDKWEFAVAPEIGGSALQTEAQVDAKVLVEKNRAEGVEADLLSQITQEAINRENEDANIQAQIDVNLADGQAADADLQSQIDAISGGGSGSLSALQAELDATQTGVGLTSGGEYVVPALSNYMGLTFSVSNATSVLDAAIKTVSDAVSVEVSDRQTAVSALQVSIAQEVTDRQAGDSATLTAANAYTDGVKTTIELEIATKETASIAADAALQLQIDNVLSNVDGTALNSLSEIVASFQAADASLNGAITALATGLSSDIGAEEAARILADSVLQSAIDAVAADLASETARAIDAEELNADNILGEQTRATNAETGLSTRIDNEEARAISAESALSGRVGVLEAKAWYKHKVVLSGTDITNGFVSLPHLAQVVIAFVDRLSIHEGASEDYTISTVGGVSKITFLNDMVSGGATPLESGDMVYFKYQA